MTGSPVFAGAEWPLLAPRSVLVLAVPWLLGALTLACLGVRRRDDPLAYAGWAWSLGALTTSLACLAWLLVRGPMAGLAWVPPAALLPAAACALRARRAAGTAGTAGAGGGACMTPPPGTRFGRLCLAVAVVLVLVLAADRIVRASTLLVATADEAVIWAAKAKALWVNGGLGGALASTAWTEPRMMHADYPLLNPLLQLWVYGLAGGIVHAVNRLPLQLFVPALALAMAGALRQRARPALAAALLLLLMTAEPVPELSARALSDAIVALAFAVALDAFARFRATGCPRWWRMFVLALTLLAWSKNEGLMLALAIALPAALSLRRASLAAARRRPRRGELAWLVLPAALVAAQWALNASHGFHNDLVQGGLLSSAWPGVLDEFPARVATLGRHLADATLRDADGSHLLLALFAGLALLFPRRLLMGCESPTAWAVVLGLAGYVLVYLGTPRELDWHLETSLRRVLFHLTPAAAMWTAAAAETLLAGTGGRGALPGTDAPGGDPT